MHEIGVCELVWFRAFFVKIKDANTMQFKRSIIQKIGFVFSFFCLLFNGRNVEAQSFQGKIMLGLNASQIDGDGLSGFNKPGILAGIGAAFPLSEKLSLEPQLLFSQKGSRTSNDQLDKGFPFIIFRLSYVELPLLVNYKISESPNLYLQGGISGNYLLGARLDNGTNLGFVEVESSFRKLDYCLHFGLEYQLNSQWSFRVRHTYSARNMNKNWLYVLNNPNANIRSNSYNNSLSFTVNYLLGSAAKK